MTYYLLLPDEIVEESTDIFSNRYVLCEHEFKVVWAEQGLMLLRRILERHEKYADKLEIKNDQGGDVTLEQFMDILDNNQVRIK